MLKSGPILDRRLPQHRQPLRLRKRQRLQHRRVHDAEHDGVGADAEGQREDGDGGEAGRGTQRADRVADVLPQLVEPADRTCVALRLLGLLDAAEGAARGEARLLGRQALADEVVFELAQVGRHLAGQLALGAAGTQERQQAHEEATGFRHGDGDLRMGRRSACSRAPTACASVRPARPSARRPDFVMA